VRYLLDTNTCIRYLNGRAPAVRQRLAAVRRDDIAVCAPVKAELFYGAARSHNPLRSRQRQLVFLGQFVSLPFDDRAAEVYGEIRADLAVRGTPIGANDLLIAAIAVAHAITLVTHNTGEFGRVGGLVLEDWETSSSLTR
jgi:tRNA(fMet)-specific endonuclease VapC